MNNDYHFVTRWRVQGSVEEVYRLISNPLDYPRWWPAVYLDVEEVAPAGHFGLGRRVRLHTKGWLPYTLRWESETVDADPPNLLEIRATGDFNGRGIWVLKQSGKFVDVKFDWALTADKPLLKALSPVMKPAFEANHRWAMEQGRISLNLELRRKQARTAEERARVPKPPAPNNSSKVWIAAGGATVVALALLMLTRSDGEEER